MQHLRKFYALLTILRTRVRLRRTLVKNSKKTERIQFCEFLTFNADLTEFLTPKMRILRQKVRIFFSRNFSKNLKKFFKVP